MEEEEANSKWLRLSSLNDFVAGFASKAVGLVPLFETDRLTVAGRCARLTSRLYHWLLIVGLVYQAHLFNEVGWQRGCRCGAADWGLPV